MRGIESARWPLGTAFHSISYEVLGVQRGASDTEIKRAFRQLALKRGGRFRG